MTVRNLFSYPALSTAGSGYMYGGWALTPGISSGTVNWNQLNNDVLRGCEFVLPFPVTIRKATIQNAVASTAGVVACGIYDANGNLLIDTGQFSATITTVQTLTLASPVTLPIGVYRYCWVSHNALSISTFTSTISGQLDYRRMIQNATRVFTAANLYGGSVMPATLGALTSLALNFIPMCLFEP